MTRSNFKSVARSQALARDAASDGAMGAAVGLLIVAGLVACNLDLQDSIAQSGSPLSSLTNFVGLVVAEAAVAACLLGAALRKLSFRD